MTIQDIYFEWMSGLVFPDVQEREQYEYLLRALDSSIFHFSIPMDENRMLDGIDLRYRFSYETGYDDRSILRDNCSTLEMMVALALKADDMIMYDYETGSKINYIFKVMIKSLQLSGMVNSNFDRNYVEGRIGRFLDRDYHRTGRGGLFTVRNPARDMRDVDIWYQMNWYLQNFYKN